jgi:membrane-bound ClpP family serine protease
MVITIAWSSVLTLGGLLGAIGIVKRMPSLEYAALPLQFVAVAAFGILLLVRTFFGVTSSVWGTLVVGMLMLALTFKLLARWFEIGWIVRSNDSRRQGGKK